MVGRRLRPAGERIAAELVRIPQRPLAAMHGRAGRGVDPTGALRDLAATLPRLHGGDRKFARRILLRPVPGEEQYGETAYTVPEHAPLCARSRRCASDVRDCAGERPDQGR